MKHVVQKYYQDDFEIIELKNEIISLKIAVNIGNTLFSFNYNDDEKLYFPFTLEEYKSNKKLAGNPFMHPWANRLEGEYFQIENEQHDFPKEQLHLLYRDGNNLPLHGLLLKSDKWKTIELYEDENLCYHIAKFIFDDENFLSIFPFKHTIQIKHQLQNKELKIETIIVNEDEKELPISFGFHPYFRRNNKNARLTIPSMNTIEVNDKMIPTGNFISKEKKWNFVDDTISLEEVAFDNGFQDLKRNENNQTAFYINETKILFDEHYPFSQIYAPLHTEKPYVCIEPMTAATNSLNTQSCKMIKTTERFTASFSICI